MLRIGHRGAAGTRPELTAVAFERAIEIGVDMIELDVQLTRDRRLVVLHDLELGRTVPGRGAVRERTLAELADLDAGSWFAPEYAAERVLSLDQVLDMTRGRVGLNVEIKSPAADWDGTAELLIPLLERGGDLSTSIVSSFSMGALRAVRERSDSARIGVLWHEPDVHSAFRHAEGLGAEAIHPLHRLVNHGLVDRARKCGLSVLTWTVNSTARMLVLAEWGVDGIISDFPEKLMDLR